MKGILLFFLFLSACRQQTPATDSKQAQIDSLSRQLENLKPGLGEFMIQVEYHHGRMAQAIAEKNYDRTAYESDEMQEVFEKMQQLHITNDKLQGPVSQYFEKYIREPLAAIRLAATQKNDDALRINMTALTNNCNSCHHENNMSFNHISY